MSSLSSSDGAPFTVTKIDPLDTNSLASIFATKSDNNMDDPPPYQPTDTGFVASQIAAWSSSRKLGTSESTTPSTLATSTLPAVSLSPTPAASDSNTLSQTSELTSTSIPTTSEASQPNASKSSTSAGASSAANVTNSELQGASKDGMSSSGLQAAIAVPIVAFLLAAAALIIFCMRRRKKRRGQADDIPEKQRSSKQRKPLLRHLRVFSFDTELLVGGRFSSTNSVRSRQTGVSQRSDTSSSHRSTGSVSEIAPPYSDSQPPTISQVLAGGAVGAGAATHLNRNASTATAPPPYGAAAGRLATPTSPTTPPSVHSRQNPFVDSPPISPVKDSPFSDPLNTVSRNSSLYRSDRDETSTLGGVSDVASIREATLARNASVMSGGRVIDHVPRASQ